MTLARVYPTPASAGGPLTSRRKVARGEHGRQVGGAERTGLPTAGGSTDRTTAAERPEAG